MANFEPIFMWVLRQEDAQLKGDVVDLGDGQGRTRLGLGEKSHPELPPVYWTMPTSGAIGIAEGVYRNTYWNRFMGDQVNSDEVASELLSFSINDGTSREVIMLQDCLNIPIDGVFGPVTLAHVNAFNPTQLSAALRVAQDNWYLLDIERHPENARFLVGWRKRAARIYPSLA